MPLDYVERFVRLYPPVELVKFNFILQPKKVTHLTKIKLKFNIFNIIETKKTEEKSD